MTASTLRGTRRTKDASGVAEAKAIALASLIAHVAGFKVTLEAGFDCYTLEHLHAVRCISDDEEGIRISQVMVDRIALRDHPHIFDRVDVVIGSANTQSRLQDTISSELQFLRDDELETLYSNLQAALISECRNVDQRLLKRSLRKVGRN